MNQLAAIIFFLLALFILASFDRHWRISRSKLFRNCNLISSFICITTLAIWLSGICCLEIRGDFPLGARHYGEIACFFNQMVFTFTRYSDTPVIIKRFQQTDPHQTDAARDYSPPESLQFWSGFVGFPIHHSIFGWFNAEGELWPGDDYAYESVNLPYWLIVLLSAVLPAVTLRRSRLAARGATANPVSSLSG